MDPPAQHFLILLSPLDHVFHTAFSPAFSYSLLSFPFLPRMPWLRVLLMGEETGQRGIPELLTFPLPRRRGNLEFDLVHSRHLPALRKCWWNRPTLGVAGHLCSPWQDDVQEMQGQKGRESIGLEFATNALPYSDISRVPWSRHDLCPQKEFCWRNTTISPNDIS